MRVQGGQIIPMLSFGLNSIFFFFFFFFHFSTVLPSSLYLDEFSKVFIKHFYKVLMFSKDLLKFHYVEISYIVYAYLLA
jgi:hypothetical protein